MAKRKRRNTDPLKEDILFLLLKIAIVVILFVVVFGFILGIYRCGDQAMSPAVKDGDLVFYYRMQSDYEVSDVVVLKKDGDTQARRIIAKEGDVVDLTEDGLSINGYLQQETDIYTETLPYVDGIEFPVTVGSDEYFVLGDNRTNAKDSRIYGAVKKQEIKGLVMTLMRRRGF